MRKLIALLLSFMLSIQAPLAFDFSKLLSGLNNAASVENLYQSKRCEMGITDNQNLKDNYGPLCEVMRDSEICSHVPSRQKLECEDYEEENPIELLSFRALAFCGWGLLNSLADFFIFLKDAVLGTLGYIFDGESRSKTNEAIGEYADSFMHYVALEYDKEIDEGKSKMGATASIAGTLVKDLFQALSHAIQEEYTTLGCYAPQYRAERVCKLIGDMTLPPAAAIALIFKLKKFIKLKPKDPPVTPDSSKTASGIDTDDPLIADILKDPEKLTEPLIFKGAVNSSPEVAEELKKWSLSLSRGDYERFKKYEVDFNQDIKSINNPSSLLNSLKSLDDFPDELAVTKELLKLTDILVRDIPAKDKFKGLNKWVKSPEHALYLFDRLNAEGVSKNWDMIRYLSSQNEYFKKALPVRGSPKTHVTFAFEKEGKSNNISLYYKDPKYDDNEWLNLPEEERIELLRKATPKLKDDVPYERIAPTTFRPNYLGKYTEETHTAGNKSYVWELKSKKYEFDPNRIRDQMAETAKVTGDKSGFHTHVVFDMANDYKHFDDFGLWTKQVNDYLYLRGMEEGLHGGKETSIMRFRGDNEPRRKASYDEQLPKTLKSLKRWSHKGFTMAVRGDIYGDSLLGDGKKVGLELRDISRDIDRFGDLTEKVAKSVSDFRWENIRAGKINETTHGFLVPKKADFANYLGGLTDNEKVISYLSDAEPYGSIPLKNYEDFEYLDYRTGKTIKPNEEQIARLKRAREKFDEEMKKTVKNLESMIENGETFETEDLQMVIQSDLTGWAKEARLSELFQGI